MDYLKHDRREGTQLDNICDFLGQVQNGRDEVVDYCCTVINISVSGNVTHQQFTAKDLDGRTNYALLCTLLCPPIDVLARVFLVHNFATRTQFPMDLLEIIGLGLRIEAPVFNAYFEESDYLRHDVWEGDLKNPYVVVGNSVLSVARE